MTAAPHAPDLPGLSVAEAAARLAADGPNELPSSRPLGMWRLLVEVASEPMFLLLGACGAVYLLLGDRGEALLLLAFVVVVVAMTFAQKRRAERSLGALRAWSAPRALVVRGARQQRIAGRDLVRGDIVLLAEGDRVPADIALLTASNLAVDESMLTGESAPVAKRPADGDGGRVYAGTLVTSGTALGRVAATGPHSALGRIGASLAAIGGELTPVQRETRRVVRQVAAGALVLAAGLGLAHWWLRGDWLRALLAGLTLAMAVLPEELPVVLTLFLGLGAWRLARQRVLARSIPAVELLGATSVLCVDKTGTLTANRMEVARLWSERAGHDGAGAALPPALHALLEYAVLASHRLAFDPMEAAIGRAGARWLAGSGRLHADWRLVDDYPLSRQLLAMSRVWRAPQGDGYLIAAKGAPEAVVDLCHLDAARAGAIAAQVAAMAADGLRVIGVASAAFTGAVLPPDQHAFDFVFLGLLALADPLRPEVPHAVAEARAAGIRVVMVTGDHPATALAIARQAGIDADACLTGQALGGMDDRLLAARLAGTSVYCRIAPDQKLRLVRALQARGEIVAMTGDGVNDAPALKAAHIGVAMGARGTDVAREAAALVLLDDSFSSLLGAVRHGRRLYANLRKALVFIVAVHVPIVGLSVLPVLAGWPMLLMPVHILFLQLIIDPACSIVFEAEPLEADAMRAPPRAAAARLFDREILLRGLAQGGGLLVLLAGLYLQVRWRGGPAPLARTAVFVALVCANLCLIHANRRWRPAAWGSAAPANRYVGWGVACVLLLLLLVLAVAPLRTVFGLVPPDPGAALGCLVVVVLSLAWFDTVKRIAARRAADGDRRRGGR